MEVKDAKKQFIDYKLQTQNYEQKVEIFDSHYDAIKREMLNFGTWHSQNKILDVGCGIGLYAEYWNRRGLQVTAVDLNGQLIELAQKRANEQGLTIEYRISEADRLPFESATFNIVFANSLIEHIPNWEACLNEWIRVLAPGGLLWVETTNVICPNQREFQYTPFYSWWPKSLKKIVENLARTKWPWLANYTSYPAVNWFSYFKFEKYFSRHEFVVRDRFDAMDTHDSPIYKKIVKKIAQSGDVGRFFVYFLTSSLIIFAHKEA